MSMQTALLKSLDVLDNGIYSTTVSTSMTDFHHKRKPAPSRLCAGFGAVPLRQKPEDYRLVRRAMEAAMAEEVSKEDDKE